MMKKILVLIALLGIAGAARPQEMLPVWVKSIGGPEWDIANTMCVTPSGEVVVSGTFTDSIDMNGKTYYSNGFTDVFVAKYNSEGVFIDAFTFGGTGCDVSRLSAYDNNVVLLSKFQRPFEWQGVSIDSTGRSNYLIAWLDDKGILAYSKTISCSGIIHINNMEPDGKGAIYLTGWYSDTLWVDGAIQNIAHSETPLLLTLQANGQSQYLTGIGEMSNQRIHNCTIDNDSSLLVVGITTGNSDRDTLNPDVVYHTLFAAAINDSGLITKIQYIIRGVSLQPVSVVKARECTWVASRFKYYCLNGTDTLYARGQNDILLAKLPDEEGETQLWTIGGYANDLPLSLSVSGDQVLLTGSYSDTIWFGDDNILVSNKRGSDLFLAVFEDGKAPVKTISLGNLSNDFPCGVATSDAGVYVLGQFKNALTAGETTVETQGSYDVFVTRFENCGAKQPVEITSQTGKNSDGELEYLLSVSDEYIFYEWGNGLGNGPSVKIKEADTYRVKTIDQYGCQCNGEIDLTNLKSSQLTYVGNKQDGLPHVFKLYPTVTDGIIYWQPGSKFPATGATMKVYDTLGRAVFTKEYRGALSATGVQTVSMGQLIPGQYLIKLFGHNYNESVKVIVK